MLRMKDKQYKISVIIATYNTGKYIEECLDSIFEQTLKELEIIIIDDGSTDNTQDLIKKYYDKEKQLIYYYQKNKGAGPARNYGIDIANGEFLAFMDPDDKYPNKDCLEKLYKAAVIHRVMISAGNILTNDHGSIKGEYIFRDWKVDTLLDQMVSVYDFSYLYGHTRYLYNTDFIRKNKIYYADCRRYQDQVFSAKALCLAGEFYEIDYPVYEYRINYKQVNMTYEICFDIMRGFYAALVCMCDYRLERMFEYNYVHFIISYMRYISKYINSGHFEFDKIMSEINKKANSMSVIEKDYVFKKVHYYKKMNRNVEDILHGNKPIIIYGAGNFGQYFIKQKAEKLTNVVGIAVTSSQGNVSDIEGIPVKTIEQYISYKDKAVVLITPGEKYRDDIISQLIELKFMDYYWVDMPFLNAQG